LDNEIRELQKHQKIRRDEKKKLTEDLMRIMKTHEVDSLDMNGSQIVYRKHNRKQGINQKFLLKTLATYFEGDEVKATEVGKFVLDQRTVVVNETIVHKLPKAQAQAPAQAGDGSSS
jgi:hypothetical protein